MVREYKPKGPKTWNKHILENALKEREEKGTSMRELSKKYNIPMTTLHRNMEFKKKDGGAMAFLEVERRGKKPVLPPEACEELRQVIVDLGSLNFAPTDEDVRDLVRQYVLSNDIVAAKKVFKYKGVEGTPGTDWLRQFLKDQRLSLKDATKLSKERHNATRNPYIIYKFYDMLENLIEKLGIADRPDLFWNADETGLPHEPRKCKVIAEKGRKTLEVVPGSDRENTTVLAACAASGMVAPPLIVYSGQQVQLAWRPSVSDPAKYPMQYAHPTGWMNTDIFFKWFRLWEEEYRTFDAPESIEPRLMLYDGHLSHVGIDTIRHAREFKVSILKLPPHTTDLLQPLDVAVFSALKSHWGAVLFKRLQQVRSRLSKAEFATLLSSDAVWGASFSKENVAAGFRKCGIYPCDREKYPATRFSQPVLDKYNKWVADGRKTMSVEEMNDIEKVIEEEEVEGDKEESEEEIFEHEGVKGRFVSYFVPNDRPNDMVRLDKTPPAVTTQNFKTLCLQRLDETPKAAGKKAVPRKGVNPYASIVTCDEEFQRAEKEVEEKENEKKRKEEAKQERAEAKKQKEEEKVCKQKGKAEKKKEKEKELKKQEEVKEKKKKKRKKIESETESESEIEIEFNDDSEDEFPSTSLKKMLKEFSLQFPPATEKHAKLYLNSVWESVCPPVEEISIINAWYAVIYNPVEVGTASSSKPRLYVGKVIRRFLREKNGIAQFLEINCLQPAIKTTTTELIEFPSHLGEDIGLFAIPDVIAGPLQGLYLGQGKWSFPDYPDCVSTFIMVTKIDRDEAYSNFLRKL